jgi:hypothetical protein
MLKRLAMGPQIFLMFCSFTIKSILTGCIIDWYGNGKAPDRKALQRVVSTSQYITRAELPVTQDTFQKTPAIKP